MQTAESGLEPAQLSIPAAILHFTQLLCDKLRDFSRANRLLYNRELKVGTLAIIDCTGKPVQELLGGSDVPLPTLLGHAPTDTEARKVREIRARAKMNEEERGLRTLFLALGSATWREDDGGRPPDAPIFLLPVEIVATSALSGDISIRAAGDLTCNDVLLARLAKDFRIPSFETSDAPVDDLGAELQRFASHVRDVPGIDVSMRSMLSNFDYQKMAMVIDLSDHAELLAQHDLVAALSGDQAARTAISASQREVDPNTLDGIRAHDELFVLDADASQQAVLHAVLRHGAHTVIEGPPGTGKSQTIANLIAAALGEGKRVLFVAEKRAALDVVHKRLSQVGLGHLVLDLHGADVKRKMIYERLKASDAEARYSAPVDGARDDADFEALRDRLNRHRLAMHQRRVGFNRSVYEMYSELAAMRNPAVTARWFGDALSALDEEKRSEVARLLGDAAAHADLFVRMPGVPWSEAQLSDVGDVARAREQLTRLQNNALTDLQQALTSCFESEAATSLTTAKEQVRILRIHDRVLAYYVPDIVSEALAELDTAVAPVRGSLVDRVRAWFRADVRRSITKLRRYGRKRFPSPVLANVLHDLVAIPSNMRSLDLMRRLEQCDRSSCIAAAGAALDLLDALTAIVGPLPDRVDDVRQHVEHMLRDIQRAYAVPNLRAIESRLDALGMRPLIEEIKAAPSDSWIALFEAAWRYSALEQLLAQDPALASFSGTAQHHAIGDFCSADVARFKRTALRIRRSCAERYIAVLNEHNDQKIAFSTELRKSIKHLPLRKLVERAPEVLTRVAPCWMASPLSVSQLLPAQQLFDLVIFDEGSQVTREDAIPAIMRGRQIVIAGDPKQLPPTSFFAAGEDEEEDRDDSLQDDTAGIQSILEVLIPFVEPRSLLWHYRSRDERLIAFSNAHIYGNRLMTLPSAGYEGAGVRHEYVDPASVDGEEESVSAEVERAVELILEHAERRPDESLGVITMGIKHQRRIEEALLRARKERPDLDEFFSDEREDRFFIKNLERVQGDERDAIILSVGYGPDRSGTMRYRFGPLNVAGGERRLNVAVTRARVRLTLLSSFRHVHLDPQKLKAQGAKLLGAFVRYAETNGADLVREGPVEAYDVNPFEHDIQSVLEQHGLRIIPQYGVSKYRLDLAVQHPERLGEFVLAIECDGAAYHSEPTARNRDRLRQQHLEALGWRFHRIWSTDWFYHREQETQRALTAYQEALNASRTVQRSPAPETITAAKAPQRRSAKPIGTGRLSIDDYRTHELVALLSWIESDSQLRTDDEIIAVAVQELGFTRRGKRIGEALERALQAYRR